MHTRSVTRPAHRRTRRPAVAAASGLAALALVLSACGNDGDAEDAVADATSAVEEAATEATSAVGEAADDATSAVEDAIGDDGDDGDGDGDDGRDHSDDHEDADRAYLDEVRDNGVEVGDDADFIVRGHDACRDLEDGVGYFDVLQRYNDEHPEAAENEGQIVIQAAVNAFCPDYQPALAE